MQQENTQTLVEAYRKLNESFRRQCVFHVGSSAGFFSEYNMMLLAMLYCLLHRIRFVLYSDDANFASRHGWTDFFEPFCPETHAAVHKLFNRRPVGSWKRVWQTAVRQRKPGLLAWKLKAVGRNLLAKAVKRATRVECYTQDIWSGMQALRTDGFYQVPELGIHGSLIDALHVLAQLTWRLNPAAKAAVRNVQAEAKLPEAFAGCQMRGGDKYVEFDLVPAEAYLKAFRTVPDIRDVFVLTDDYRIVEQLRNQHKEYRWHTLCQPAEHGYYHNAFVKSGKEQVREQLTRFFASIDLLTRAARYVGTRTSNPSVFLYICMPGSSGDTDGNPNLLANSTLGIK